MFLIYGIRAELNQMSQIDIVVLPTIYVCALVTGFLMNTCSKRKIIRELEDRIDTLECENDVLINRLGDAEEKLRAISQHLSEPIDS
jgi:chaperonin cofactor prefoldin